MFNKLKKLLASDPSTHPVQPAGEAAYKKQGDKHLSLNEYDQALACYRLAISARPGFVEAHVGLGFALAEQQRYQEAEAALTHALSIDPALADAHYILGKISASVNDESASIRHFSSALELKPDFEFAYRDFFHFLLQAGKLEDARSVIQKAISAFPESAEFHFLLGNLLFNRQDFEGAVSCHTKVVALEPTAAVSHKILGDAHRHLGHLDRSIACYQNAVAFDPDNADAHVGLGDGLAIQEKNSAAIACYRRAIALKPDHAAAHRSLGNALFSDGDKPGAIASYRQVVALQPDSPVAHLVAAMSEENSETAHSGYVEQLFDEYAQSFDSHLVQTLRYEVPEMLAELLRELAYPPAAQWLVLDLGCGTGLSGLAVSPYAKELVGVDLSGKMLAKARARSLYARLEQGDVLSLMQAEASGRYDLLVSLDVLVYIGKLDELFAQAKRVLRPDGLLAFSVESLDAPAAGEMTPTPARDYQLNPTGRYSHSAAYLARMALHNGFETVSDKKIRVRVDQGKDVPGHLMLWRCLAGASKAS